MRGPAATQFDDLARALAAPMPRRRALALLGGALAAVVVPGRAGAGNNAAAQWCHAHFSGSAAGKCTSDAAHGGGPYYECGPGGGGNGLCGTRCCPAGTGCDLATQTCRPCRANESLCRGICLVCPPGSTPTGVACECLCPGGIALCNGKCCAANEGCDLATQTCRQCRTTETLCRGACVECPAGSSPSGSACECLCPGGVALCNGKCCAANEGCDLATQTCRPCSTGQSLCRGICVTCPEGATPVAPTCECVCAGGVPLCNGKCCAANEGCDLATQTCKACGANENVCRGVCVACPPGATASPPNCACTCAGGVPLCGGTCCGANEACDLATLTCRACGANESVCGGVCVSCPAGAVATGPQCECLCADGAPLCGGICCPAGSTCDVLTQTCRGCQANSDCPTCQYCYGQVCYPSNCPSGQSCCHQFSNDDCGVGIMGTPKVCKDPGCCCVPAGGKCGSHEECCPGDFGARYCDFAFEGVCR